MGNWPKGGSRLHRARPFDYNDCIFNREFFLFAKAMKTIPIGTAYAIFTGIGAAGTAVVGIIWFNEAVSSGKVFFLFVLLFGIIGLKLVDDEEEAKS